MNTTYQGYFVPTSMASNYVRTKKDSQGANIWDTEAAQINIDKQRALQSLNDRYSKSLNDAYANYLAQKNLVANSSMGQGYKMAYDKALGQNFAATEQELNSNVSEARQTIESNAQSALDLSQRNFETNVANLNRIGMLSESYLNYVKSLRDVNNEMTYFGNTDLTANATLNDLYAKMIGNGDLFTDETIAAGYVDEENQAAKSFTEFVNSQIDTERDKDFYDWFLTKGYNEFRTGVQDKTREYMSAKRTELDNTILSNALESGSYQENSASDKVKIDKYNNLTIGDTKIGKIDSSKIKDNSVPVTIYGHEYDLTVKDGKFYINGKDYKEFMNNEENLGKAKIKSASRFSYGGKDYKVGKNADFVTPGSKNSIKLNKELKDRKLKLPEGYTFKSNDGYTYIAGANGGYYRLK